MAAAPRRRPPNAKTATEPWRLTIAGVPLDVHPTARARRISLRVSRLDGRARVTAPLRCSRRDVESFVDSHADWLAAAVARAPEPIPFQSGGEAPFQGVMRRLEWRPGRRAVGLDPLSGAIIVGGPEADLSLRVAAWMRDAARAELTRRSSAYADALGTHFAKVSIRDTRSRWGSCSSNGGLSYSWRLIMAPIDVLDYVAAHEVAHLREMNHSPRFWALVEQLRPDWRRQRDWLRRHGAELHRYGR